jgi:thiamine-phosphate pyrophosphorylase
VAAFAELLTATLAAGDVASLQLRLPGLDDEQLCRAIDLLRPPTQRQGVAFLLDGKAELACETGCDGVHIDPGRESFAAAREAVGSGGIVGVGCRASRHAAMTAAEQGADYVSFGAFYPSSTVVTDRLADPELLSWWAEMMLIPVVAVGGITVDNAAPMIAAGADFLAVSAGVWRHAQGPAAAVAAFGRLCAGR